jgi:hypothetical protein
MTVTTFALVQHVQTAAGTQVVYTVPAGLRAVVFDVRTYNWDTAVHTINVTAVASSPGGASFVLQKSTALAANTGTASGVIRTAMNAGDFIEVSLDVAASTTPIAVWVSGQQYS